MAYAMNDRVREQVSGFGGGTGAVTLPVSAVSGFQTFLAGWGASGTGEYLLTLGSQWETGLGTLNAGGTTLTRTTVKNGSSGAGVAVNFAAGTLDCSGNVPANLAKSLPSFGGNFALINGRINCTVGSSALTIAIKTSVNTDPTAADPVFVIFRNATIATGDYTVLAITAATSLVISSGSTMGAANSVPFKLWVVGFNDAGTFRLGAINPISGYLLDESAVRSSTAEGGAGAADSANVFYTGTAVTSKAFRVLASLDYPSGLGTVGTWSAAPTTTHLFGGASVVPKLPTVQKFLSGSGTYTTPAGVKAIRLKMIGGGGGGGGGGGAGSADGGTGGNTTFGSWTANGGGGGGHSAAGIAAGGSTSGTADIAVSGGGGSGGHQLTQGAGGAGGNGYLGGGGAGGVPGVAGSAGSTNTGGGGGGGSNNGGTASGGGGGSGGFILVLITTPSATYSYAVGAAGTAGGAGASGAAGGAGGSGGIWVEEFYD